MYIRAGEADAAAVAELQRDREALSRSAAQRIADNRRAARDRDNAAQWVNPPAPDVQPYANADAYYPAGYAYMPPAQARHRRPDAKDRFARRDRASTVPNPPRNRPR
jgi:hypothetical protein